VCWRWKERTVTSRMSHWDLTGSPGIQVATLSQRLSLFQVSVCGPFSRMLLEVGIGSGLILYAQ
jgi:hypothetical protein